jgi:hypothetical protein
MRRRIASAGYHVSPDGFVQGEFAKRCTVGRFEEAVQGADQIGAGGHFQERINVPVGQAVLDTMGLHAIASNLDRPPAVAIQT